MSYVLVDRPDPAVAVVTLNRPERMNAMSYDVMVPFRDTLLELGQDNTVRAVVVTGAGSGFCSGADQESAGVPPGVAGLTRPTYALRAMEVLEDVVLTIRRLHQPVVAAVNGAAIGGSRRPRRTSVRPASTTASPRASSGCPSCCRGRSAPPGPPTSCSPGAT